MKQKAHDAAEEAAGVDLDGDGKVGQHSAVVVASAPGGASSQVPAQSADDCGFGIIGGILHDSALQTKIKTTIGTITRNKVKPEVGSGTVANMLAGFHSLPQETQLKAEAVNKELDDGTNLPLSACTGRRRALLIGINYAGTSSPLKGCINDVLNMKDFIVTKFNFPTDSASMRVLVDDGTGDAIPTKDNIFAGMKWLIEGAQAGDSLFIHYSGHGTTTQDVRPDKDEADDQDETLVPLDFQQAGMIIDDDIFDFLVAPIPRGVRLTAIMDCCHSGSVFDLPYSYVLESGRDLPTEVDNRKVAIAAAINAGKALMAGDKANALKYFMEAGAAGLTAFMANKTGTPLPPTAAVIENNVPAAAPSSAAAPISNNGGSLQAQGTSTDAIHIHTALADVIQFSGCMDDQTSADAFIGGQPTGAMSYAFIKAFNDNGMNQTYAQLLRNVRAILEGKYKQIPQMSVGHRVATMDEAFKM